MLLTPRRCLLAAGLCILPTTGSHADSIARTWNEQNLAAIRLAFPDPPVHARNLFHISAAMWDAWAAYDSTAVGYLHREAASPPSGYTIETARHEAISYAAYRILTYRYWEHPHPLTPSDGALFAQADFEDQMTTLGYPVSNDTTTGDSPAAVGNRVAETILSFTTNDGSNELGGYTDPTYAPANPVHILERPWQNAMSDPNRWQPLEFAEAFSQTGIPLDSNIQTFVGSHWGDVWPFALSREPGQFVYEDPGPPPYLGGVGDADYKAGNLEVLRYSSLLDPDSSPEIDCSPGVIGNNPLGTNDGTGHSTNPVTTAAYAPNPVKVADFGRVLAEFWADGPESETPPGHWNVLANEVTDTPGFTRSFMGSGDELDPLEWDVKMYFAINASVHDAAVAAWGCKRFYDYVRPITAIRHMASLGQSSNPGDPSYHEDGLPLVEDLVEVVTAAGILSGRFPSPDFSEQDLGRIAVFAWGGEPATPTVPPSEYTGTKWILAENWLPYQRDTFVTPAFAGYISGHSAFSRAAAEVLTRLTGSAYFPGGLGTHTVPAGALAFELGPSAPVELQWATYYDAADQAGISRLYGGIHVPVDDGPGRVVGSQCGIGAWDLAVKYFDGSILTEPPAVTITALPSFQFQIDWRQYRGLYYNVQRGTDLQNFTDVSPPIRATTDRATSTLSLPFPSPPQEFYRVEQSPNP